LTAQRRPRRAPSCADRSAPDAPAGVPRAGRPAPGHRRSGRRRKTTYRPACGTIAGRGPRDKPGATHRRQAENGGPGKLRRAGPCHGSPESSRGGRAAIFQGPGLDRAQLGSGNEVTAVTGEGQGHDSRRRFLHDRLLLGNTIDPPDMKRAAIAGTGGQQTTIGGKGQFLCSTLPEQI